MGPGPIQRLHQTRRLLRSEGLSGVSARVRDRASRWLSPPGNARLPVPRADLQRAAEIVAEGLALPEPLPVTADRPLTIAWLLTPPGGGSGGHTTMFRLVAALERAGHRCVLYLVDQHGWAIEQHERTIRSWWPWVKAEIRDAASGVEDAHAIFATAWETAYSVLASPARGARFYLVQDFEPWFYPAGSESLLAEATYRFGFHGVTAGRWLSDLLSREYSMRCDHFDFGRDPIYALDPSIDASQRTGVCFYAKAETPRRAFSLAVAALELFSERHPEVPIHLYGTATPKMPFRVTHHGVLTPEQLNALYNRCVAGLVLSATNVSLVPHEMLASGCIPVVNDAHHNRVVLDNDHVAYAPPTPFDLAAALSRIVERPVAERAEAARAAAASVGENSWEDAGDAVVRVVEDVLLGQYRARQQPASIAHRR